MNNIFNATEAKQKFGKIMTAAQRRPVQINKHDSAHVFILSAESYQNYLDVMKEFRDIKGKLKIKGS